ncbi:merozoite surface protein 3b [Nitratireductor aestuarii]|uniref:Merozoite surface protein 3b n=1 Tax=Nitratireductor aestuarii TaxID=1735103 RepID=A0A916W6R5_9HYPH|nr:cell surface protein [Nitratireductor aestuarii]GGA71947.1 merozoite surface protein 3b [Nitratireductor aestuarii]
MSEIAVKTPLQYLDLAMGKLRDLGLVQDKTEPSPIVGLLEKIADIEPEKIAIITRTLQQMSIFNEVVREQVAEMEIGTRYEKITKAFDSIRDDAKTMVDQIEDGKLDIFERATNAWMKISRGDIATRFDEIKDTYLEVSRDTKANIEREQIILEAYRDFRGALKHGEVAALEILKAAENQLNAAKEGLAKASEAVSSFAEGGEVAERARLELIRDEHLRRVQNEEGRYQVAKDLADNMTISYNTSEVVMARLMQTTNAKERVYQQAVSFFSTNESVLTALKASFTGLFGLHEATQTLNQMKEGVSKSLETLAEIGGKVQEEALKAGYGPTIRADAVKKLVDSVVNFQTRSVEIISEMRELSTRNSAEIRDAVEDGKKRIARLAAEGNALVLEG